MLEEFITEQLSGHLQFPRKLEEIYVREVNAFRQAIPGFGRTTYTLDDESLPSVAWQFDRFFTAHFYKTLYSLLKMEYEQKVAGNEPHFLGCPTVTVFDIGCGSGAASLAVLALIDAYQHYRVKHKTWIRPIKVQLIGVDMNDNMLELYKRVVSDYANLLAPDLISSVCISIAGEFPQDTWRILHSQSPLNQHSILTLMSNVIRPLDMSFMKGFTRSFETVYRRLRGEKTSTGSFGASEGLAIKALLEEWKVDRVSVLSIGTRDNPRWPKALAEQTRGMQCALEPHGFVATPVTGLIHIEFVNPAESFWKRSGTSVGHSDYYWVSGIATNTEFGNHQQWQEILSSANLKLAWARARHYILHEEVLADEAEIRLFDYDVNERIERLRLSLLAQDWFTLNVSSAFLFHTPKKSDQTRPKAITRLEEQLLGAATIQRIGVDADRRMASSYSHRLNPYPTEFLYEHWFRLYRLFLEKTHQLARRRPSIWKTDITGFYQRVDQTLLSEIIGRELRTESRLQVALDAQIHRKFFSDHKDGEGLPQGHIASGFWANLYLGQVDGAFHGLDGVDMARYADDMVFAIDPSHLSRETVENELRNLLRALGSLELAPDKTVPQDSPEYLALSAIDKELDDLNKEIAMWRIQLFRLDLDYKELYAADRWRFLSVYQQVLRNGGIFLSAGWLSRKIEQQEVSRGNWWSTVTFPAFPATQEEVTVSQWWSVFEELNTDWIIRLDSLRKRLVELFLVARKIINDSTSPNSIREAQVKRLKFAVNRLCELGLFLVADDVASEILENPWRVPIHLICPSLALCGREDLLLRIIEGSQSPFVRAVALRALGHGKTDKSIRQILWSFAQNDSSAPHEKLKATESLLAIDIWDETDYESCLALIERETDPYLKKNYILVAGRAFGGRVREYLGRLQQTAPHAIVIDAIQYLLSSGFGNLTCEHEPEDLRCYYARDYPDSESDTKSQDHSIPGFLPV